MQPELTAALERALLRALQHEWRNVNACFFRGALRPPTIELSRNESTLGRWHAQTRTLEISRPLVLSHAWRAVVEVLKHEMAHQFAHEVLGARDESSHGRAFREVCTRLGIDARASGVPDVAPNAEDDRIVERIAKLLALAESDNQHEAEAAMAAAQKLMLKHNLESIAQVGRKVGYEVRHLGEPSGRVSEHERLLAMILGKYFFVEVIWVPVYRPLDGKQGSVLEICGTRANVAMAEYVHAFLSRTATELWSAHKRASGERSNRDRRTFLAGVMTGFADKLKVQAKAHDQAGLVWVGDADLHAFYRRRHPYVRSVRYGGSRRTDAYDRGREHGRNIVLNKPVDAGSEARGRALPPKR
jgi:hypothetical protein